MKKKGTDKSRFSCYFFHWSTKYWLILWEENPQSIPPYATHHVCDLLFFGYPFVKTHFGVFL